MTKQQSISLDLSTVEQIAAIRAKVAVALGTNLTVSRVVNAAIRQYHDRIMKATEAISGEA